MTNKLNTICLLLILIGSTLMSCKPDDSQELTQIKADRQELLNFMKGTWSLEEVRKDNVLVTDFNNFTISFTEQTYTTTNGAPIWPAEGSFRYADETALAEFIRLDGISLSVVLNGDNLQLSLNYQEEPSNRLGIEGDYQFFLVKD